MNFARIHAGNFAVILYFCLALSGCSYNDIRSLSTESAIKPAVEVPVSPIGVEAGEPAIAADENGNIYVAYVEHGADKTADLYLQKYNNTGAAGNRVRINPDAGSVKAWRGDQPTLQISGKENVYIGWNLRSRDPKEDGNDLMLSVSTDGGKSFAPPLKVNDDTAAASHGMHGMSMSDSADRAGYFAWLDERGVKNDPKEKMKTAHPAAKHEHLEPNAEIYFSSLSDNGKVAGQNKKIAGEICPCCKVSVIKAGDGRTYISWRQVLSGELRHIAVTSTSDNGQTFAEPAIVSDDKWQLNACPVSGAPLAMGSDGTLRVAWYTAGDAGAEGLYWASSADQGKTFSPRMLVSEGVVFGTPVLVSNRVIWTGNGKIMAKKLSAKQESSAPQEIAYGELPSAAAAGGFIYLAYVKDANGKKAIYFQKIAD
ncbi:MAG TPA: sialidase family protein [Pyrinomonadaceae bacterium]|jgi:hypothetical protein|nr:sialidase family protein [Pyrinomonadaceae bacterium]